MHRFDFLPTSHWFLQAGTSWYWTATFRASVALSLAAVQLMGVSRVYTIEYAAGMISLAMTLLYTQAAADKRESSKAD